MKAVAWAGALCVALISSACAADGVAPVALSHQQSRLTSHLDYSASIKNAEGGATLHVTNTHRGQCMYREFPTQDIPPNASWTGTLETKGSGSCAFADSVQIVKLRYKLGVPGKYLELEFVKAVGRAWRAQKLGGEGSLRVSQSGSLEIRCDETHSNIACVLG